MGLAQEATGMSGHQRGLTAAQRACIERNREAALERRTAKAVKDRIAKNRAAALERKARKAAAALGEEDGERCRGLSNESNASCDAERAPRDELGFTEAEYDIMCRSCEEAWMAEKCIELLQSCGGGETGAVRDCGGAVGAKCVVTSGCCMHRAIWEIEKVRTG